MSIKDKYSTVLGLMREFMAREVVVREERGTLIIRGNVRNKHQKQLILEKADEVNVENGWDIDIKIMVKN
ncbi:MAG TPA: hypothetical protein VJ954_02535 [Ignavibacteriaceae bacterium]|nr:hypothetical protein [Ignavibacteriaceae bacterium]